MMTSSINLGSRNLTNIDQTPALSRQRDLTCRAPLCGICLHEEQCVQHLEETRQMREFYKLLCLTGESCQGIEESFLLCLVT